MNYHLLLHLLRLPPYTISSSLIALKHNAPPKVTPQNELSSTIAHPKVTPLNYYISAGVAAFLKKSIANISAGVAAFGKKV